MNPATAMLLEKIDWPELEAWVAVWDQVEQMLLAVYRTGMVSSEQSEKYRVLRGMLRRDYKVWQDKLSKYWGAARVDGKQLREDPFLTLTADEDLRLEKVDWAVVQTLPAAREALNSFLLDEAARRKDNL